jgi:hypothetical protein
MTDQAKGTELAHYAQGSVAVADVQNVRTLAKDLLDSGLFPGVRNIAGAVTIIQAGLELGVPPVAALSTMVIISGRIAMEAKLLLALAHNRAGVTWKIKESESGCWVTFSRPGWTDIESSFTEAEAKAANLLGKDNWRLWKKDMYFARAAGRGSRRIAPDALLGLYAKEEMEDSPASLNGSEPTATRPPITVDQATYEALKKTPVKDIYDEFNPAPEAESKPVTPAAQPPSAPIHKPDLDLRAEAEEAAAEPLVLSGETEPEAQDPPEESWPAKVAGGPTLQQMEKFAKFKVELAGYGIPEGTMWDGIHRFTSKTYGKVVTEAGDFTVAEMDMVLGYLARWKHAQEADKAAQEKKNVKK